MTPAEHYLEIVSIIRTGNIISAVKHVQDTFGLRVKEAKDLVEAIASQLRYNGE